MGGDWNFVERQANKSTLNGIIYSIGEKRVFLLLKDALAIEDHFPEDSRVKYS